MILKLIGDTTNRWRGISFLWGPLAIGLEIAWSPKRWWFLGKTWPWPGRSRERGE